MKKIFLVLFVVSFSFACLSCSKTRITGTWTDPDLKQGSVQKVLVIGVGKSQLARRTFEEDFVMALRGVGVEAYPSYRYLSGEEIPEREKIIEVVHSIGVDYVLVTALVGIDREQEYHPPQTYVTPRYGGFYPYYRHTYDVVHQPGYYSTQVKVMLETKLYSVELGKPVWMAQSTTMNPDSSNAVIKSVIPELVKKMQEQGIFKGSAGRKPSP